MMTSVLHMPTGKMPTTTANTAKPVVGSLGTIDCPRSTLQQQQQQNTSSPSLNSNSSLPEVARNLAETATNTANTANTQQNNSATVKPGLPSPSSTSETSDYQRSTPSPNAGNEDQLRSLGSYI